MPSRQRAPASRAVGGTSAAPRIRRALRGDSRCRTRSRPPLPAPPGQRRPGRCRHVHRHVDAAGAVLSLDLVRCRHDHYVGDLRQADCRGRRGGWISASRIERRSALAAGSPHTATSVRAVALVQLAYLGALDQRRRGSAHIAGGQAIGGQVGRARTQLDLRDRSLHLDLAGSLMPGTPSSSFLSLVGGLARSVAMSGSVDAHDDAGARAAQDFLDALAQIGEHVAVEAGIAVDRFLDLPDRAVVGRPSRPG